MSREHILYAHRRNGDGTYDSICWVCYRTVSHQFREADLAAEEASHVCKAEDLLPRFQQSEQGTRKRDA
jgi:hypothetical protein